MQLCELRTCFNLWMGMAETKVISKPFNKQKDKSQKKILFCGRDGFSTISKDLQEDIWGNYSKTRLQE